ncbi:MAG TPA: class I SAM-dependent methyltransferase [Caulobacteraceae bacterium]|nr:class I SAM-dependent methyltransferase [Caulobacteraceae bacterium]
MGLYERYLLPPLLGLACGAKPIRKQREKIVPRAQGVVLELGFGAGLNLPHYDRAKVTRVFALEPAAGMLARARKAAAASDLPVEILAERAEALSLPAASVDTVLVTYSLCTIPDAVAALEGARRAMKPGARLLFCEHGAAPDPKIARAQRRIEPVWKVIGGGCHLTRDIPALIAAAGFAIDDLATMFLPGTPPWAGYNFWGSARAR